MIEDGDPPAKDIISFGPFRLIVAERRLERDGVLLPIGARTLDVLVLLLERAGEVVGKKELVARVWPDVTVDESSLQFHMAALRKLLGDGQAGARYVVTLMGRGYCFVAPLSRSGSASQPPAAPAEMRSNRLPALLTRMVGRDGVIETISSQLIAHRFVTIVGTGGIGKTTVAAAMGHKLSAAFDGKVHFIDLGDIGDPRLIPSAVASALGLPVRSSEPVPGLVQFLRDKHLLLVLDGCEHVIEAAATLAERIFGEAQQVHLLATSREPMRVEGEHVQRLPPLSYPTHTSGLLAAAALASPAIQLFVERAAASDDGFVLSDADAPVVAEMCRKLDGIALAIELVAGRVSAYGIRGTDELLNSHFELLWRGRRTAPARHQTLTATLDWSYNLLSEIERLVLRRLSIFTGAFTLEALRSIAPGDELDKDQVIEVVATLVGKSLLSAGAGRSVTHFRLLETTLRYALKLLADSGELDVTARRHAAYFRDLLESINAGDAASRKAADHEDQVDNVRAALDWSFSQRGEIEIGIALAAAAAPMFLEMSLMAECQDWCQRAIGALDLAALGTHREMELQARLGQALMFTPGKNAEVCGSLARGLEIADTLEDSSYQLRFLESLRIVDIRMGDCRSALALALRFQSIAEAISDSAAIAKADILIAISYHLLGDQLAAQSHCEAALARSPQHRSIDASGFYIDDINHAFCTLSRVLWLRGNADQAARMAREAIEDARAVGHPMIIYLTLTWLLPAFFWIGDWSIVEEYVDLLAANSEGSSLILPVHGEAYRGYLAVKRNDPETGIALLRRGTDIAGRDRYITPPMFAGALAEGLAMTGRFDEALTIIDGTIPNVDGDGGFDMPEMLRIKAGILTAMPHGDLVEAERCLFQSLELAHSQSALFWELRTATSLAELLFAQGRADQARDLLGPIYGRFTEGFGTSDLRSAKRLLDELSSARPIGGPGVDQVVV